MRGREKQLAAKRSASGIWVLLCLMFSAIPLFPQSGPQAQNRQGKTTAQSSLTGCVDENNGRYILVDDREMKPIAELEAVGFPNEGFAKHLGHKVTVRGDSSPDHNKPLFRVHRIETVSDTCTPEKN